MSKKEGKITSKTQINNKKPNPTKLEDDLLFENKKRFIKYFLVIGLSTIVYLFLANFLIKYYTPDIVKAIKYAKEIVCVNTANFLPEPQEKALYYLGIFVFTISFFVFIYLFNKFKNKLNNKAINVIFFCLLPLCIFLLLFITYKGFSAQNPFYNYINIQSAHDYMNKNNWEFYFSTTFLYDHLYLFTFFIYPLILFFYILKINFSKKSIDLLDKIKAYSTYLFCGIIIIIVFLISAFKFPYVYENKYDFNAVYYSVIQVYHGAPLLVNDFTNTYGLYPHFIVPILKIFGLSIYGFTIIMACLLSLCFIFILIVFNKYINNKWLILFGFTTLFFNCYMYSRIVMPYDNYFAICPIRWLFIFLLIFYAFIYLEYKTKKLYYLSFLVFSTGILWNPEFGIISYLCLISFYCFIDLDKINIKQIALNWLKNIATAVIILIITFLCYELLIKLFYGQFPELNKMFSTIQIFSFIGSGMLPMPKTFHPYMIIVGIYLIGLFVSINNIIEKSINNKTSFIFILTCLGILMFVYYLGRSHNWNLFSSNPVAFILLTIFADDLLKTIKSNKSLIPIFAITLYFLSFSLFQTIYDYKRITDLVFETKNKKNNIQENTYIKNNAEFIKSLSKENEKVLILSIPYNQGLYHNLSNTCSAFNPGFVELSLKSDYNRLMNLLKTEENIKVFFEPNLFRFDDIRIISLISSCYQIKQTNGSIFFLQKRKETQGKKVLLSSDKNVILHKVLDSRLNDKLEYALGEKGKIDLTKQFTIEIIIRPNKIPQSVFTQSATIFSNRIQNKGLILQQNDTVQNEFLFGFSNQGIRFKVELNKWNYLVFIVDLKKIICYDNGNIVGIGESDIPYENVNEPFYIGTQNSNPGLFFGDIKEIKISNSIIDNKEIISSWNKMKNNLSYNYE